MLGCICVTRSERQVVQGRLCGRKWQSDDSFEGGSDIVGLYCGEAYSGGDDTTHRLPICPSTEMGWKGSGRMFQAP